MLAIAIIIVICILILGNFILKTMDVLYPKKFDDDEYIRRIRVVNPYCVKSLRTMEEIKKQKPEFKASSYIDEPEPELKLDLTKSGEDVQDLYDPIMFNGRPDIQRDVFNTKKSSNGKEICDVGGQLVAFEKDFEGIRSSNRMHASMTRCGPSRDIKEFIQDGYH